MSIQYSQYSGRRYGLAKTGVVGGVAVLLAIGLFGSLVVLAVAGIFAVTRPVVDASEQFLGLLGEGKVAEAYDAAGDGLRAQQDEAAFARAVNQLGLLDYSSVTWHNREIQNHEAIAEGTVVTKRGSSKPVFFQLVREGRAWKVVGLRFGGLELAMFGDAPVVPPEAELERIATTTLLDFDQAVQSRDFAEFYGTLSDVWKKQTTPQQLQTIFQEFIDKDIDIGAIKDFQPQLTRPAAVNDNGVLVIAGEYTTAPQPVRFELEYAHERTGWKLLGISVNVGI
jgi:hypothetical protein